MTENPPKVRVAVCIFEFDCEPGRVSEALGVEPTDTWSTGDRVGGSTMVRKFNGWRLFSPRDQTRSVEEHLQWLLSVLPATLDQLSEVSNRWSVELCVEIDLGDFAPEISLAPDQIGWLARWRASLDIDVTVASEGRSSDA